MFDQDVIVVGGGVSGLSFAAACAQRGLTARVLEATATPGGCIQSHREPDGFWFELGAHTCYNSYGTLLRLLEERGAMTRLRPRVKVPFRVLVDGKVRSIAHEVRVLELLRSAPRAFGARRQGQTVRSFYSRLVGPKNYEHLFGPLFAAVPSQPADEFPAEMLFKRRPRRKGVLRSFTLDGGLQTIADVLAAHPGITLETGAEVTAVDRDGLGLVVHTSAGAVHRARHLAIACPPDRAASVLATAFPALATLLARVRVIPIESIGVIAPQAQVQLAPVAGVIPLDRQFFSLVSRDPVPHPDHRAFTFHFRAGTDPELARTRIDAVLGVPRAALERVVTRRVSLPSPTLGHRELVGELDRACLDTGASLFLCGNYFGGLAIEDCVSRSIAEVARLVAGAPDHGSATG